MASKASYTDILPSDIRHTIKDKIQTLEEQEVKHLRDRTGLCTGWAIMMIDQMGEKGYT